MEFANGVAIDGRATPTSPVRRSPRTSRPPAAPSTGASTSLRTAHAAAPTSPTASCSSSTPPVPRWRTPPTSEAPRTTTRAASRWLAGMRSSPVRRSPSNFPTTAGAFDRTSPASTTCSSPSSTPPARPWSTRPSWWRRGGQRRTGRRRRGRQRVRDRLHQLDRLPHHAGSLRPDAERRVRRHPDEAESGRVGACLLHLSGRQGFDGGSGLAVDSGGNAYVAGGTGSTNFPTTAGAFDTTSDGERRVRHEVQRHRVGPGLLDRVRWHGQRLRQRDRPRHRRQRLADWRDDLHRLPGHCRRRRPDVQRRGAMPSSRS